MSCLKRLILLPKPPSLGSPGPMFSSSRSMSISSSYDQVNVCFEDDGQIAVIKLNDPARLNAINVQMGEELDQLVQELKGKDGLRAAILTGEGINN